MVRGVVARAGAWLGAGFTSVSALTGGGSGDGIGCASGEGVAAAAIGCTGEPTFA